MRALLAALADPDRGFDAVVVGEYERAFCGDQLARLAPTRGPASALARNGSHAGSGS
jgi:hypothetical protein